MLKGGGCRWSSSVSGLRQKKNKETKRKQKQKQKGKETETKTETRFDWLDFLKSILQLVIKCMDESQ